MVLSAELILVKQIEQKLVFDCHPTFWRRLSLVNVAFCLFIYGIVVTRIIFSLSDINVNAKINSDK